MKEEHVVLLNDFGGAIGTQSKSTVHHAQTPLHLAFSIFLFDGQGRSLFQQRALHKATWPGVWSNACCGHPLPGESMRDATRRRLAYEIGVTQPIELELALPDFRYRAQWGALWENEICPVFVGHYDGPVDPHPDEVASTKWIDWESFAASSATPTHSASAYSSYSPWSRWEAAALLSSSPPFLQTALA